MIPHFYDMRMRKLDFCTLHVCTFDLQIMFDSINYLPGLPVSVSEVSPNHSFLCFILLNIRMNVSISELDIFPNEYSGWNENLKGHTFCSTR